jgi:hypothetical protein
MGSLTEGTDYEVVGVEPGPVISKVIVKTINTVDAADTLTVTLTTYGIAATGLIGVLGFKHTTDNSVMEQEQPTTAVSSGVLTVTVPSGSDNDARFYIIYGFNEKAADSSL